MIINKGEQAEVLSNFSTDSIDMTIDDSDKEVLMHILSTGLYQDPIGSLIRENVSNNLDATVEAGSTEPVIVGIKQDGNYKWYFYSQDFGTGISPERMEKIVSKYAASTKRGDGKQKGYFGLGLKSGLAYTDSFWIITNHDGTAYSYLMYKGEEGSKIELMDSQPTTDKNGTTFKVYMKDSYHDRYAFQLKIKEQLSYIENLYFDIDGFNNKYSIYKADNWWFTPSQTDKGLHIVLDGIYYPIDFNKLGIRRIEMPIALKFDLSDGLVPVPSRESVIMSPATKQKILDKIKVVAEDFIDRYNQTVNDIDCWFKYTDKINTKKFNVILDNIHVLEFTSLLEYTKDKEIQEPSFTGFKFELTDPKELTEKNSSFFSHYSSCGKIIGGYYTSRYSHYTPSDYTLSSKSHTAMTITGSVNKWKTDYIKDTYRTEVILFRKSKDRTLSPKKYAFDKSGYHYLLGLARKPKAEWRDRIKEFQAFEAWFMKKYFQSYDDLEIPQDWIDAVKEERKKNWKVRSKKEAGKFLVRRVWYSDRADWGGTYENIDVDSDSVKSLKGLWVYGTEEDKEKLAQLASVMTSVQKRIKPAVIAKANLKRIKDLKNFITYDEFMEGETKPFKIYATAIVIAKGFKDSEADDYNFKEKAKILDRQFYELIERIESYSSLVNLYRVGDNLLDSIVKHATENNLFDPIMMSDYQMFIREMKQYSFLSVLEFNSRKEGCEKVISLAREILKYRRLYKKKKQSETEVYLETEVSLPSEVLIGEETKEIVL